MAVTGSGLYVPTWVKALDSTIALNLEGTIKGAMFTDDIAPDFDTDTAYGVDPYDANEVTGTGYTAGGATLGSPTLAGDSAGGMVWDGNDLSWSASTIADAKAVLLYADSLSGDPAIALIAFSQEYSTTNGTFTVQWHSDGIVRFLLVPETD